MALQAKIKKKFFGFTLDVEFETKEGCMGILGASGCGKSMTLKCIAGIEKPDSGRIVLNGRVLFDSEKKINLPVQKRNVGYLFQNYALFPTMTVEQNLMVVMEGKKEEKRAKIKEQLERFELSGLEKRYPSQLSGGQQQRLALARQLANLKPLLILDDPFSALDRRTEREVFDELRKKAKDSAVLLISHRLYVFPELDGVLWMQNGVVRTSTHAELMASCPEYAELYKLQQGGQESA